MNEGKKFLKLVEAAKVYGVDQDYLRLLINKGILEGRKAGRVWVTTTEWMEHYLESHARKPSNFSRGPLSLKGLEKREDPEVYARSIEAQIEAFLQKTWSLAASLINSQRYGSFFISAAQGIKYTLSFGGVLFFSTIALAFGSYFLKKYSPPFSAASKGVQVYAHVLTDPQGTIEGISAFGNRNLSILSGALKKASASVENKKDDFFAMASAVFHEGEKDVSTFFDTMVLQYKKDKELTSVYSQEMLGRLKDASRESIAVVSGFASPLTFFTDPPSLFSFARDRITTALGRLFSSPLSRSPSPVATTTTAQRTENNPTGQAPGSSPPPLLAAQPSALPPTVIHEQPIIENPIRERIIERTIERVVSAPAPSLAGIPLTEESLTLRLSRLNNELRKEIFAVQNKAVPTPIPRALPQPIRRSPTPTSSVP